MHYHAGFWTCAISAKLRHDTNLRMMLVSAVSTLQCFLDWPGLLAKYAQHLLDKNKKIEAAKAVVQYFGGCPSRALCPSKTPNHGSLPEKFLSCGIFLCVGLRKELVDSPRCFMLVAARQCSFTGRQAATRRPGIKVRSSNSSSIQEEAISSTTRSSRPHASQHAASLWPAHHSQLTLMFARPAFGPQPGSETAESDGQGDARPCPMQWQGKQKQQ